MCIALLCCTVTALLKDCALVSISPTYSVLSVSICIWICPHTSSFMNACRPGVVTCTMLLYSQVSTRINKDSWSHVRAVIRTGNSHHLLLFFSITLLLLPTVPHRFFLIGIFTVRAAGACSCPRLHMCTIIQRIKT